ncbi:hypothetical protein ACH5RR_024665 [Cinchona calisaya]|uniref:Small ribosomal subunit protein uS15c n=1 Tax=Cinchona calisaya TaxID=153742 RepID=A0ABD2YXD0_9GENT
MAAATKLLQIRPKTLPTTTTPTSIHFFSSSTTTTPDPNNNSSSQAPNPPPPPPPPTPPPQSQSQSQSPYSSFFSDVRASLKRNPQSPPPRKTFTYGSSISNHPNRPSKIENFEEIRRHLSEFRLRSAPPSPPSSSASSSTPPPPPPHSPSFQEIYQRNHVSEGEGSNPDASKAFGKMSFDVIRQSIRNITKSSPVKNQSEGVGRLNSQSAKPLQTVFGGSDALPLAVFGRELAQKEEGDTSDAKTKMEFLRTYDFTELGEKLRALRPEKQDKKDWFSFEELSARLVKLREMEEKENDSRSNIPFSDLRLGLTKLKDEKVAKKSPFRLDVLGYLGRTPDYMLSPPKEELVEKYFHPDNMSASEKLKLELKKVRDEFKISESDCGSARVQVAQLTTKIKHLATVLHKKDKHSRKGLQEMVQRRKKLLKYLRRTDWDSYSFVLSKLGLRDNPDYKN